MAGRTLIKSVLFVQGKQLMQVLTTLKRRVEGDSDQDLEDFVAGLGETTILTDSRGSKVTAGIVKVDIHDGQVDVVFDFDPDGWRDPSLEEATDGPA